MTHLQESPLIPVGRIFRISLNVPARLKVDEIRRLGGLTRFRAQ